ncbi:GIN domain-containing protein [Sessilibacter sp. MAH4]
MLSATSLPMIHRQHQHIRSLIWLWSFAAFTMWIIMFANAAHAEDANQGKKTFNLSEVHQIDVSDFYQVTLIQGDKEYVTATGPSQALANIDGQFQGNVLSLGSKTDALLPISLEIGIKNLEKLVLENVLETKIESLNADKLSLASVGTGLLSLGKISAQKLKITSHGTGEIWGELLTSTDVNLTVSGSGNVNIFELKANHLRTNISGSAGVHIDHVGEVETSAISLSGSGLFDAANLIMHQAEIAIAGSANALVNVLENLDVSTSGSGTVTYYGNPNIDSGIFGTGLVRRAF